MLEKLQPTVSIIIKALNEERHIASAIESALAALCGIDGEVILADGRSSAIAPMRLIFWRDIFLQGYRPQEAGQPR
jgi:hypothetical protein